MHAEKLLIYGRKSSDSTDLQTCTDGDAQLVTMQCGDKLITGNEECDPPGGCCDPKCKLISGFQWQPGSEILYLTTWLLRFRVVWVQGCIERLRCRKKVSILPGRQDTDGCKAICGDGVA